MQWVNMAVKPFFSWPCEPVEFEIDGRVLVLSPESEDHACTVSIFDAGGITFDLGGRVVCEFLSRLAWSMNAGVSELFVLGSNNPVHPGLLGHGTYGRSPCGTVAPWDLIYLPEITHPKGGLSLALFREGMSINSIPFAFLSYFKILNTLSSAGAVQKRWINDNLSGIWYQPAIDRLMQIQAVHSDVGAYLYHQGRCAVAHSFDADVVNPDNYSDKRRLEEDLPLMKEIAALCIEKEFGVLSSSSFSQQTLAGDSLTSLWKKAMGSGQRIRYIPA